MLWPGLPTVPLMLWPGLPTEPLHPTAGLSRVTRRLARVSVSMEAVSEWHALSLRRAWFGSPTGSRPSKTPGVPPKLRHYRRLHPTIAASGFDSARMDADSDAKETCGR